MEIKTEYINLNLIDICYDKKEIFFQELIRNKIAISDFLEHCKNCSNCGDTLNRYIDYTKYLKEHEDEQKRKN